MKRLRFFALFVFIFVCGLELTAQTKRMNVSVRDASLAEVLNVVSSHGYQTFFNAHAVAGVKGITLDLRNATVGEVLDAALKGTNLTYSVTGNTVVISVKREEKSPFMEIKGVVTDTENNPLPGVTVREANTFFGVATDVEGKFTLRLPTKDTVNLIISFVGMRTEHVMWTGQKELRVRLRMENQEMDEVVVTGYMNVDRRDMVGSYTTLKMDDIMMPAYTTIDQMLQGVVPGMIVMNTSSRVGTSPRIQIRGTSTLLGNQDPLWVVDGIIQEDPLSIDANAAMIEDLRTIIGNQVSWLNPNDIESITVLKDASATAIYGSRASNGVIVITTKKGKTDRLSISYSGNFSFTNRPNYGMFNLMNSQERIQFSEEAFNEGIYYNEEPIKQPYTYEGAMRMYLEGEMSQADFLKRKAFLESVNTDWFDLLTRNAFSHNHNVSISGGTEKFNFRASIGFNQENGQEIGNSSERMSARLSVDMQLHEKVRATMSLSGTVGTNKSFSGGVNPLDYATTTSRAVPAYDEEGEPVYYRLFTTYQYNRETTDLGFNILNERDNSGATSKTSRLGATLDLSWEITDWLTYQFTGGYNYSSSSNSSYATERTYFIANRYRGYDYNTADPGSEAFNAAQLPFGGTLFSSEGRQNSYNIQNKLLVSKTFNADHRLNVLLGVEVRSSRNESIGNTVFGYVPDRGETVVQPTPPDEFEPIGQTPPSGWGILGNLYGGGWSKTDKTDNFFSMFATVAYSLKNRYVFNANVRNDASNRFGQDINNRFDPTYSFGFSWRVSEEEFMASIERYIHNLNLKATYGIQGNALTNLSPELILMQRGVVPTYNQYYSTISRIPNPELSWERTRTWNWGLELGLFRAVNVNVDYYWRRSNAVIQQDLSYEFGVTQMELNGGILYNSGLEVTVNFSPINRENFGLSVSLNSSKNWNKGGEPTWEPTLESYLLGVSDRIIKEGYPLGAMWSYSYAGLNPENGRPMFNLMDVPEEERSNDVDPTTFLVYSGQKDPYFTGGLSLGIRYKTLSLNSSFSLLLGGHTRLPNPYANFSYGTTLPSPETNVSRDVAKRWKKPGDEQFTDIPALIKGGNTSFVRPDGQTQDYIAAWAQSDHMLVSSSFLRCRQIGLTWNVERNWCKKLGLASLSVSANVNNLFVIANKRFDGFDLELGDSVMPKMFSAGINVGF